MDEVSLRAKTRRILSLTACESYRRTKVHRPFESVRTVAGSLPPFGPLFKLDSMQKLRIKITVFKHVTLMSKGFSVEKRTSKLLNLHSLRKPVVYIESFRKKSARPSVSEFSRSNSRMMKASGITRNKGP